MTQLEEIKLMNKTKILYLQKLGKSAQRNEIIDKILNDDTCFFKIDKNDALIILEDIGISKNNIDSEYSKLISRESYYQLQQTGKIKDDDEEIIIRYPKFDSNDLFKNNNESKEKDNNVDLAENKENIIQKIINRLKKFLKIGM